MKETPTLDSLSPTERIEVLHQAVLFNLQMYASELITLPEFVREIAHIGEEIGDVTGVIDPCTGLPL